MASTPFVAIEQELVLRAMGAPSTAELRTLREIVAQVIG